MRKTIARLFLLIGLLVITGFVVVVANQTAQLVDLATRAAPWMGSVLLWTLLTLYAFCILTPLYLVFSLPKPLNAPASEDDPAFPAHLERIRARLRVNPHLSTHTLDSREELELALSALDEIARERTRRAASQVFITTAISQNGNLDTFLVLAAQSKLVLEVARTYYQRPTLRDLVYLYSNVAATAFVAGEIDDLDLAAQVQPIVGSMLGSTAGAIPGLGGATTIFMNSVMTGTANAFLTLRVGVIAAQYCRSVVLPARKSIRRRAVVEATGMLGGIAYEGSRRVMASVTAAGKNKVGGAVGALNREMKAATTEFKDAGRAAASKLGFKRSEPQE